MEETLKEIQKLKASWERQKQNKLKDGKICDAYIHAFDSVLQLLDQESKKAKKKTDSS